MNTAATNEERCPECGAIVRGEADKCWLCGSSHYPVAELVGPGESPFAERTDAQFSLSTLMLGVTLLAVLFGVFCMAPGAGVVLAVLVVPPFLATCIFTKHRKARGQPMSAVAKLGVFGSTFGIVIVIAFCLVGVVAVAAVAAFFVICVAGAGQ
ncbi:MAG: hypothetical protein H8E44_11545 [Planctomycetes bacterium]|nr:hypothetical protein [Planctomycetota bacterium]MBL7038535.1 hypothetical protein [Pirellulaceae bacterium]